MLVGERPVPYSYAIRWAELLELTEAERHELITIALLSQAEEGYHAELLAMSAEFRKKRRWLPFAW